MSVATFTKSGNKATSVVKLDKSIFGVELKNHELLKEVYLAELANARTNLAKTKKRGEVRGGGSKPWRQKGTGRARFGSSRNPIWEGGGVAFGPTGYENYSRKVNAKAKKLALRQALSSANREGNVVVIESINFSDSKTKSAAALIAKLPVKGKTLIVAAKDQLELMLPLRNLKNVNYLASDQLSAAAVLNASTIIFTNAGLEQLTDRLGDK